MNPMNKDPDIRIDDYTINCYETLEHHKDELHDTLFNEIKRICNSHQCSDYVWEDGFDKVSDVLYEYVIRVLL